MSPSVDAPVGLPAAKRARVDPVSLLSPSYPAGWRNRDAVVASGIGLHAQMQEDLVREANARPQSGLSQKTFCEPWTFEGERYAFWSRVRGCVAHLATGTPAAKQLNAQRESDLERIDGRHTLTERRRATMRKCAIRRHVEGIAALIPEPMRCSDWRALRFYPQVVRSAAEVEAFLDPQATDAEVLLAVTHGGLDALIAHHPELLAKHPALATALVTHFVTSAEAVAGPFAAAAPLMAAARARDSRDAGSAPAHTKTLRANAFLAHLRALTSQASQTCGNGTSTGSLVPPAAVARLVDALSDPVQKYVIFAACVLRLVPPTSLVTHAEAVSEAVSAHVQRRSAGHSGIPGVAVPGTDLVLTHLEKLVKRAHDPKHIDMEASKTSAMARDAS